MMRRTFKSDFGTLVPLLASQCRHTLLLLATNTIDAAGSPDCLGPGSHCLSRLFSGVYVQEVTFCFWLSCAFFCFLSFFYFSPCCDPAIWVHRMMCIVRFPRSTIAAAAAVVAVVVVVGVVGPRLCRGSKVRYLSEQGHVVVVGCSTLKHHPTPTSYIKKHPTLLPLFQDQPHQRASDMRHKTTHRCVHSALLVQSTLKWLVCDCPSTKQEARQCEEMETKGKKAMMIIRLWLPPINPDLDGVNSKYKATR